MTEGSNYSEGSELPQGGASEPEGVPAPPRARRGRPPGSRSRRNRQGSGAIQTPAFALGGSIQDTIRNSLNEPRDYVVMVRVSKSALEKLDELVECGLLNSRSTAAAFLISEGIRTRDDLYSKIAAQTEVIREARVRLQRLLDE